MHETSSLYLRSATKEQDMDGCGRAASWLLFLCSFVARVARRQLDPLPRLRLAFRLSARSRVVVGE